LLFALLLAAAGLPAAGDDAPAASIFLVARAELPDPNFEDTVVLITQYGPQGALGVIVNRPTNIPLSVAFPDIERLKRSGDRIHFGGPVARSAMTYLFRSATAPKDGLEVMDGVYMSASLEVLKELLARDKSAESLRVFAGHAGWAPGQLESEISRGDWRYFKAEARSIFERRPEALWPELNRRANATTARLGVQLDHVSVGKAVLMPDLLAVESGVAPDARVAQ
jgi:putative transcriptional regulator